MLSDGLLVLLLQLPVRSVHTSISCRATHLRKGKPFEIQQGFQIPFVRRGNILWMSEGKSKWNVVLEGDGLQDKNHKFSAIKIFQLQREDLTELKLSKGMYQI